MKRLCAALSAALLLSGCAAAEPVKTQYSATFLDLFDTVTTVSGMADSEDAFRSQVQPIYDQLLRYHRLFDIYHSYEGMHNLKTVNDCAGTAPVTVDDEIIALLQDCRNYHVLTGGKVNAAMGSVLQLWHTQRSAAADDPRSARLPEAAALQQAAEHVDFDHVILNEAASTVYFTDPQLRLDVGAIAKGWAAQRAAESAPEGFAISIGGNICLTGAKDDAGTPWTIGIRDPDGGETDYVHTIALSQGCVVTSGDYQRAYTVGGTRYHHIIDPQTLYPANDWRSVTVVCADSGLADALSTALFLLPLEDGRALAAQCGAQALWIDSSGALFYSEHFTQLIRT